MALPPFEFRIHTALSEYLLAVRQGGANSTQDAWAEKLKSSAETLETLLTEHSPQLDPRLRHFMESKSYRKAHDYLAALLSSKLANSPETRQSCAR